MNWEAIRIEYEETEITPKDLAEKHGVKPTTLRSRINRGKWQKRNAEKYVATQRKKVATKKAEKILENNDELLGWEIQFCYEYLKEFNATKAYLAVRDVTYNTAAVEGSKTLKKPKIKKAINDIKKETTAELFIETSDITRLWLKQAYGNIGDFVDFGTREFDAVDEDGDPLLDEEGNRVKVKRSYIYFKNMNEVDTSLIQEVKMGKDGPIIKLHDQQKALQELSKRLEGAKGDSESKVVFVNAEEEMEKYLYENGDSNGS